MVLSMEYKDKELTVSALKEPLHMQFMKRGDG